MSQSRPPHDQGSTALDDPSPRRRRGGLWWLWLLAAIVIVLLLLLLLSRCNGDDNTNSTGTSTSASPSQVVTSAPTVTATSQSSVPSNAGSAPTTTSPPAASGSATAAGSATATGGATAPNSQGGTLTAGGTNLLPVATAATNGSFSSYNGMAVTGMKVTVLSVPADEGFWIGTSAKNRVWVQLTGSGESPYQVKAGDEVDLTGTVQTNGPGFAKQVGVTRPEGAVQLTREKSHISVKQGAVMLSAS